MTNPARPLSQYLALVLSLSYLQFSGVLAQSGDGGAAEGVQPGSLGSDSSDSESAASAGPDTGSANLSHGAVIAIAVVVSLVVVLGTTTAVLFFLAKKRQWKIKEGIRRSARRVTSAVKAVTTPLTPKKMTFSPIEKRLHDEETTGRLKKANAEHARETAKIQKKQQHQQDEEEKKQQLEKRKVHDVEKGVPEVAVSFRDDGGSQETSNPLPRRESKSRPRLPNVKIPSSAFEMDSPKTPVWKKVFGR